MDYKDIQDSTFLVSGGAGFIGSHIAKRLLHLGAKKVKVIDNLSTGNKKNVQECYSYSSFEFVEADIRDLASCISICSSVDYVFHQAALGSVPRSFNDPVTTNAVNTDGFLNMLQAAKLANVRRFIYASSSSVYGDSAQLPKVEEQIGMPISPYAVSKYTNELYAHVFTLNSGMETIGLRYFNVFGPHQNPNGAYAAVIPLFVNAVINGISPTINGDGKQTRDFTYVENVVDANLNALIAKNYNKLQKVFNVATGNQFTVLNMLNELNSIANKQIKPNFNDSRSGDITNSLASIEKATQYLGYNPKISFKEGLKRTYQWFKEHPHFFTN